MSKEITHNQGLRNDVNKMLETRDILVNGKLTPVLGDSTRQIILECRDGRVSAIRSEYKIIN